MCSRLLAATLAVLIGSTAEVGATLIVVYRSDSEVVIAADSRGNTERGTHKDDFCKIWDYGDLVFAHSGTHQTGAFSISAILDGGVLGPGSGLVPWSRIERFIPIVNTGLTGARLSYQDAHFVGVFAYRTEGALVAAFTPTALPTEPVRVTKLVEDEAFVQVGFIEKTLNIPEDTLMTLKAALGVEETLVRLIKYGAQASDTVGGPIDVIRLTADGTEWLRQKPDCR